MTTTAETDSAPAWFQRALAAAPDHREHTDGGLRLHYRAWGEPGGRDLILVHGGSAHSGWWDHVAPLLGPRRVLAPDLSGHGDSGWRDGPDEYGVPRWGGEVAALARAEGLERPVLVGHSMGGSVATAAAALTGLELSGLVIIDTPLDGRPPGADVVRAYRRPHRVYPSLSEAAGRFRTVPAQDVLLPYVARHIAEESLRPAGDGWTWKFDPNRFGPRPPLRDMLAKVSVPAVILRCEHGLIGPDWGGGLPPLADGAVPAAVTLPDAGHHPMLDQPLSLVTALRSVLALWGNV